MKRKLLVALTALTLGISTQSHAAFAIKKTPVKTEVVTTTAAPQADDASATTTTATVATETKTATKHSMVYRLLHKAESGSDVIPLGLYILMAILPLGWLAMGLNDDFTDFPWILSLILYILGYLPGVICTLLFIPRYY